MEKEDFKEERGSASRDKRFASTGGIDPASAYTFIKPGIPFGYEAELGDLSPWENCTWKALLAGGGGAMMGLVFGVFMSSMENPTITDPKIAEMSTKEQLKIHFRSMRSRSFRLSKQFAGVGLLYSGIDCMLAKERAKQDMMNALYTGCATGGLLAMRAGPAGMAGGCATFAAFTYAIELWMRS